MPMTIITAKMDSVFVKLIVLRTPALDRLKVFFECLGLAFVPEKHGNGPPHFAGTLGDATLELYPLEGGVPQSDMRLGFAVSDLAAVLAALKSSGTPILSEVRATPWGSRAVVRDPDGRTIELYSKG